MAKLEISGKIIQIDEPIVGKSSKGEWKKQQFIVETEEQYPKKICFINWNDKVKLSDIKPGQEAHVHFDAESREYNGRWYTDLKVWRIDIVIQKMDISAPASKTDDVPPPDYEELGEGDLPF